ncbi:hypothetical protein AHF37_01361 [Paragonimus kellicotti]|nr:hypothetical protein AHF37_01361 [Paragonimus kellicotti]
MVLLAASVCTKDGKGLSFSALTLCLSALVSRQFVEMTKARIEGLIVTFPKLLGEGKQHTFVETESVRYVYQPLEQLYVLLITTKASNILEDLETLRLFARVIPEYACGTDEADILNNAFQIIFAFDEIVALGYREDVNFSQIRTYTEMDSHEERVFRAVQEHAFFRSSLHLRIEEKLIVQVGRDGGLEQMEVQGIMQALAASTAASDARIHVDTTEALNPRNERQPAAQLQTHPNLDKKAFLSTSWLQIKPGGKSFPIEQEVGVLRWRLQTQDESVLPITINCWPNEIRGGFEVNIEYELQNTELELHDVCLSVPLPPNSKSPAVGNFDGDYEVNSRKTQLDWRLPLIDASSPSGSIEFTLSTERGATADQFFPLKLTLHAAKSICGIRVVEASDPQGRSVPFSTETRLYAEKYEIV